MTCQITTSLLTIINHMQRDKMTIESCCCYFSVTQSRLTLCNPMNCSTPGFPVPHRLMSIESVIPSNHLVLCCRLFLLPLIFPSIRVFSNESALHIRWPKYWSFSFRLSPSNEYSELISFKMDWLVLPAVQGLSRVFSNTTVQKINFLALRLPQQSGDVRQLNI